MSAPTVYGTGMDIDEAGEPARPLSADHDVQRLAAVLDELIAEGAPPAPL